MWLSPPVQEFFINYQTFYPSLSKVQILVGLLLVMLLFSFPLSKEHKSVILMLEISLILGKYIGTHTCIQAHIQHNYPRPILFFCYLQDLG